MMNLLVPSVSGTRSHIIEGEYSLDDLYDLSAQLTGLHVNDFYLLHNGRKLSNYVPLVADIHVIPRFVGGKGGFGSMLRAIGAQIEKTTNREACRDLSGRRLRDINEEKRLKNWLAQKEEREREAKERKRKKIERMLQEPKVEIKDEDYSQQRSLLTENISDSVEFGLKVAEVTGSKRKPEEILACSKPKRGKLLLDLDIDSDEISSDDSDEDAPSTSGVQTSISKSARSSRETDGDDESPSTSGLKSGPQGSSSTS